MALEAPLALPGFQGPLDLLLSLIERRRLEITEVSLAAVADQYLQAVRAREPDPDVLGEFLVIAARLLLLKSRALLPRPEQPDEEDAEQDDLVGRLEAYRRFKDVALALAARFEIGERAFPHPPRPEQLDYQPPLAPLEAELLARLWQAMRRRQVRQPAESASFPPRVEVSARLSLLRQVLAERGRVRWEDLPSETLDELIATFLALLELVRRSEATVSQEACFGPIVLQADGGAAVARNGQAGRGQPKQVD